MLVHRIECIGIASHCLVSDRTQMRTHQYNSGSTVSFKALIAYYQRAEIIVSVTAVWFRASAAAVLVGCSALLYCAACSTCALSSLLWCTCCCCGHTHITAQTFFVDEDIQKLARLDGIITLVDAKHILPRLDEIKPEVGDVTHHFLHTLFMQ
jgi:hypothetical protein